MSGQPETSIESNGDNVALVQFNHCQVTITNFAPNLSDSEALGKESVDERDNDED